MVAMFQLQFQTSPQSAENLIVQTNLQALATKFRNRKTPKWPAFISGELRRRTNSWIQITDQHSDTFLERAPTLSGLSDDEVPEPFPEKPKPKHPLYHFVENQAWTVFMVNIIINILGFAISYYGTSRGWGFIQKILKKINWQTVFSQTAILLGNRNFHPLPFLCNVCSLNTSL